MTSENNSSRRQFLKTAAAATATASFPVSIPDFHATIHAAMGIDSGKELFDGSRPVPITDGGNPIAALFG